MRRLLSSFAVLLAVLAAFLPLPAAWIERVYSGVFFPRLQAAVTTISNLVPFALFDLLIIVILLWWITAAMGDVHRVRRERRGRAWVAMLWRTITASAVVYLIFLLLWGLNYRRVPLLERMPFDRAGVKPEAALALLTRSVDQLNALSDEAHRQVWTDRSRYDPAFLDAFAAALRQVEGRSVIVPGRPKSTLLDLYFRRASVAGMTDPFFLETLLASDLLFVERPSVLAHEWAHLAGFADESEASFVAWLACLHGTAFHRYSGWLLLYQELAAAVPFDDFRRISAALGPGPRADLDALRARAQANVSPRVAAVGWGVYDGYLKANRVEEGTRSYSEVVTLVLGNRLPGLPQ